MKRLSFHWEKLRDLVNMLTSFPYFVPHLPKVWSQTDNLNFTFLNLPPDAISQELASSILRQFWLDSIAKWSVILSIIRKIIRRTSFLCCKIKIYDSFNVLGTSKYNVHMYITSSQTSEGENTPSLPTFLPCGEGDMCTWFIIRPWKAEVEQGQIVWSERSYSIKIHEQI